jgi:hypothetical protein
MARYGGGPREYDMEKRAWTTTTMDLDIGKMDAASKV